jgi:hypothetical protein
MYLWSGHINHMLIKYYHTNVLIPLIPIPSYVHTHTSPLAIASSGPPPHPHSITIEHGVEMPVNFVVIKVAVVILLLGSGKASIEWPGLALTPNRRNSFRAFVVAPWNVVTVLV